MKILSVIVLLTMLQTPATIQSKAVQAISVQAPTQELVLRVKNTKMFKLWKKKYRHTKAVLRRGLASHLWQYACSVDIQKTPQPLLSQCRDNCECHITFTISRASGAILSIRESCK